MSDRFGRERLQLSKELAKGLQLKVGTAIPMNEIIDRVRMFVRPVPAHVEGEYMVSRGWGMHDECGGRGCRDCFGGQIKFVDKRKL